MLSKFFIEHPVFASVLSIVVILAGGVSYFALPVEQYPDITPPVIRVEARYPGASATVVAETVAAPIEQEVNGVENMLYMVGTCASDGSYQLDITFEVGTDVDIATVLVQNRVAIAEPKLPEEVKRQGVTTKKQSTMMIGIVTLRAVDEAARRLYDDLYLANYLTINVKDEVLRIRGVGNALIVPSKDYGMRVWLNAEKLQTRDLTTTDVVAALREQNVQVAAGVVGQAPAPPDQGFQFTVTTLGRLTDPEQFGQVIVKTGADGRITRLADVARIELGARSYDTLARVNGGPGAVMIVYMAPGANATAVASELKAALQRMRASLPRGLELKLPYDVSKFIEASIEEVYHTLFEAFALVLIVVVLFLQNVRATLVPITTVPVSLIGTFAGMALFGFSVNFLTLFGLILAIGIVVDDAIVVVENVERVMKERHLPPKEATIQAMAEIIVPVISITLVLMAVFVPTAFLPGISGRMYRQFALTIAISTAISALNALTLKPVQCSKWLRPHDPDHRPNAFSRAFNAAFDGLSNAYGRFARWTCTGRRAAASAAVFALVLGATLYSMKLVPTGFLPLEDRGLVLLDVQLPDAASQRRSAEVMRRVETMLMETPGVADAVTMAGFSLLNGNGSNRGFAFAMLEDWEERDRHGRNLRTIFTELRGKLAAVQEAQAIVFSIPAIDGLGNVSGFDLRIQDRQGFGGSTLQRVSEDVVADAAARPRLWGVNTPYRAEVPQVFVDIDREKVKKMGVALQTVFDTLQAYLGSLYVNDFNLFGRTWQVNVQADAGFRARIDDVGRLKFRNPSGEMVPLSAVADVRESLGAERVVRYNMYPSAQITGEPAPGSSSGESLKLMERIVRDKLPAGMDYQWTALAFQEQRIEGQGNLVFVAAIVVVFLILAAQYNSWTTPMAVVLSIPLAILGAMAFLLWAGLDNNIYTSVGLVLLVGLGAKNAILIVEFARENLRQGATVVDAAVEAARTRLRPILMTSFAFILGCVPLATASGAGAAGRVSLGVAVIGGMLANTVLGLLFTPVLFVVVESLAGRLRRTQPVDATGLTASPAPSGHL